VGSASEPTGADEDDEPVFSPPRRSMLPWLAVAAAVLVGLGLLLLRPSEPDGPGNPFRGGPGDLDVSLAVLGDAPVPDGAARSVGDPVRFQVVTSGDVHLALVEVQGDRRSVLWPKPGGDWHVGAGIHVLTPTGQSPDYRPGEPGLARYELIAAPGALDVSRPEAMHPDAEIAATATVLWN